MLKKSKVIALLVVCVMMFAAVEPALAWWGEDTAYGTAVGGATGGLCGGLVWAAFATVAVIASGGLAAVPLAGAAIGGAALTGATIVGGTGAVAGAGIEAATDKETVDACAKAVLVTGGGFVLEKGVEALAIATGAVPPTPAPAQ